MAGSVKITLDEERELRLDINALADADEIAGASINAFLIGERVGISAIRALLWAGLNSGGAKPRLTLVQTGALIQTGLANGQTMADLIEVIRQALRASGIVGDPDEAKKKTVPADNHLPSDIG